MSTSTRSLAEIKAEVKRLATLIGASEEILPTYGYSEQSGRPHIEVDENGYHYVGAERGNEFERSTTRNFDDLLYHIFESVTHQLASDYELQHRIEGADPRRLLFERQFELLSLLSPRWAKRYSEKVSGIIELHPFRDS